MLHRAGPLWLGPGIGGNAGSKAVGQRCGVHVIDQIGVIVEERAERVEAGFGEFLQPIGVKQPEQLVARVVVFEGGYASEISTTAAALGRKDGRVAVSTLDRVLNPVKGSEALRKLGYPRHLIGLGGVVELEGSWVAKPGHYFFAR